MKYRLSTALLAVLILMTGCASTDVRPELDSSGVQMAELVTNGTTASTAAEPEEVPQPAESTASSSTSVSSDQAAAEAVATTAPDANNDFDLFFDEVHEQFELSDEELSFVEYSLFVGDSICSGFSEYGIVPHEHVAAKGNLGSRSFFDYTFKFRGWEGRSYDQVLKSANPRYVFLSMGMNDVNMVDEEEYCENYRRVIEATLDGSRADVFVAAITPVCSKFCGNSVIDSFNDTMRKYIEDNFPERVHFFDFGRYLKNDKNELRECLHSGDGVHLGPYCYRIALWEMHRVLTKAGLWDGEAATGTFDAEDFQPANEPVPVTTATTAETTKPAKTTKPDKTTKPAKTTTDIPVDTGIPVELPVTVEPPEDTSAVQVEPEEKTADSTLAETQEQSVPVESTTAEN